LQKGLGEIMRHVWLSNVLNGKSTVPETASGGLEQDDFLWQEWLSGKMIGEPKPTDETSVDQLKEQGYVGVYKCI
jgi:hypothetical protein